MDTELLKTFIEIAATRHFGKAADNLCITQAAVSARIKQLEAYLGVNLFIRQRNNLQLSAEGERFLPHAKTVIAAWARARQEVALQPNHKQQLSIGTTPGIWQYALQKKLGDIHRAFPQLHIKAEAHTSEDLTRLSIERVFDIILLYEPLIVPDFTCHSIGKMKLGLLTSSEQSRANDAINNNYIYIDWGTSFGVFHAKRYGDAFSSILHTNMASVAEYYMLENPASAYLPLSLTEQNTDIKAIEGAPIFTRNIHAVYRSQSETSDIIGKLLPLLEL